MDASAGDIEALIREKYNGNEKAAGLPVDLPRLSKGEPLAYVIGNIPFLGVTVHLDSHPLIPRPETEWWTELLITHIKEKNIIIYDSVSILDLCAGSGAIGLAVLKHCPNALVAFGELDSSHTELIRKNIEVNRLNSARATIRDGDLFAPFSGERYDFIATNPPYIPDARQLDAEVTGFEPNVALYGGADGLDLIRRIVSDARDHLTDNGELWMECDIENIHTAQELLIAESYTIAEIRTDQYGRERIVVAHL